MERFITNIIYVISKILYSISIRFTIDKIIKDLKTNRNNMFSACFNSELS